MTHILVTNDDGVFAPSLLALVRAVRPLGKVTVLAPDRNWSASGHVKTLTRPLRIQAVKLEDGSEAIACDGAPSDCVALARLGYIEERIDLVVSGINPYPNVGNDLTYSGTVAAAMEAVIFDTPGIAFSYDSMNGPQPASYDAPAAVCQRIAALVIRDGLPPGVLLNVNIPNRPDGEMNGFQVTRQGKRIYRDLLDSRVDPMGRPYYWIGGEVPTGVPEEGTDIGALSRGCVSITPIHLDLTAHHCMNVLQAWDWHEDTACQED